MLLGLPEFEMVFPASVGDACSLMAKYAGAAQALAGGTDLLVKMKHRRVVPRALVNLKRIPLLDRIGHDGPGVLRIGALATVRTIEMSPVVHDGFPVLARAAELLGTTQVRNLGTLGGNLANASPAAEFAPALLVLGASVRCVGMRGERSIPLEEFFIGPGRSSLQPDELITEVLVPPASSPACRAVYLKHGLRRMDVAMVGAAVLVQLENGVCREVRIALGAAAPVPFRAKKAEQVLRGKRLHGGAADAELLEETARVAAQESQPIDDLRASADDRREIARMLVRQGLERALARTGQRAAAVPS